MKITWRQRGAILIVLALMGLAWAYRRPLSAALSEAESARAWLLALGALGPLMLILINAAQIVLAPIPGYFVQAAAGWVFGLWPGAVYGAIGLGLGGGLAAWLSRTLGRPFAARMVGAARLQRWEQVTRADSPWLWALLLLGPVVDIPYFLAGLSQFPIPRLIFIAVLARGPSVLLASAVGAGAVTLSPPLLAAVAVGVALLLLGFYLFGARIQQAAEARLFALIRRLRL